MSTAEVERNLGYSSKVTADPLYCLPLGGLKPPASAGSLEHDFVNYDAWKIIEEEVIRYFNCIYI